MEAYDLYLRGRFQWNKRSGEGFHKALECFEHALEQDPNYAPAYSGIADHHIAAASWGLVNKYAAEATAQMYNEKGGVKIGNDSYKIQIVAIDDKLDTKFAIPGAERLIPGPCLDR